MKKFFIAVLAVAVFTTAVYAKSQASTTKTDTKPLNVGHKSIATTYKKQSPSIVKAAKKNNLAKVKKLLDKGIDPNSKDKEKYYGFTPLMWAGYNNNLEMAEALINAGADATITSNYHHTTPLIELAKGAHFRETSAVPLMKLLAENGVDPNAKDLLGQTALNKATMTLGTLTKTQTEKVELVVLQLIAMGVNVNEKDAFGNTALFYATKYKLTPIVRLLEAAKADSLTDTQIQEIADYWTENQRKWEEWKARQNTTQDRSILKTLLAGLGDVTGAVIDHKTGTNIGSTLSSSVTNATTTSGEGTCKYGKLELSENACNKCVKTKPLNQSACTACCNSIGKVGLYNIKYYATDPAAGTKSAGYFKPGCYCHYSDGKDYVF